MKSIVPAHIGRILEILRQSGYQAYIAGGAVRDLLLGITPKDYDIATDALIVDVARVMSAAGLHVVDGLGKKFGVIVVVIDHQPVEVATFRGEKYGRDAHRPEKVWFGTDIFTDLSRRDFTINAMALDSKGNLIDPFDGQIDLATGVIRTVGEPKVRFAEDALRMFRACRFAARLGFVVDDAVLAAISLNLARVAGLSLERVRSEIEKTLLANHAALGLQLMLQTGLFSANCRLRIEHKDLIMPIMPELTHLLNLRQNPRYHCYDVWRHSLAAVESSAYNIVLRWAALLHDVGKGLPEVRGCSSEGEPTDFGHDRFGAEVAAAMLKRLGLKLAAVKRVKWLISRHMRFGFHMGAEPAILQRWLRDEARRGLFHSNRDMTDAFKQLVQLCLADISALNSSSEDRAAARKYGMQLIHLAAAMPVHTSDLKVPGREIMCLLEPPQQVGRFLQLALRRIQDGNLLNQRQDLLTAAVVWNKRQKEVETANEQ